VPARVARARLDWKRARRRRVRYLTHVRTHRLLAASTLAAVALLASACASRRSARLAEEPISPERDWASKLRRDHPLVGKIWDQRGQRFVDEATLAASVSAAEFVILGEVHDNPDHHAVQARLVGAIGATRRPALAFEMLEEDDQPAVDSAMAREAGDPDAIARAVDWEHSGWYAFSMYRPIFAAGLAAKMPIVAANLPRKVAKDVAFQGEAALPEKVRAALQRAGPLAPETVASWRDEMKSSHCDAPMPEEILDRLALAQRARDAQMALRMIGGASSGAVLVTGNGHARVDRAVPDVLGREAPGRTVLAVGVLEVQEGLLEPSRYAADLRAATLPYDLVVFTPATEREDPCLALRGHDFSKPKPPQ
jgi:uncharacterized iron-regulated protein